MTFFPPVLCACFPITPSTTLRHLGFDSAKVQFSAPPSEKDPLPGWNGLSQVPSSLRAPR